MIVLHRWMLRTSCAKAVASQLHMRQPSSQTRDAHLDAVLPRVTEDLGERCARDHHWAKMNYRPVFQWGRLEITHWARVAVAKSLTSSGRGLCHARWFVCPQSFIHWRRRPGELPNRAHGVSHAASGDECQAVATPATGCLESVSIRL